MSISKELNISLYLTIIFSSLSNLLDISVFSFLTQSHISGKKTFLPENIDDWETFLNPSSSHFLQFGSFPSLAVFFNSSKYFL